MQDAMKTMMELYQAQIRASTALANALMAGAGEMQQLIRDASKMGGADQFDFSKAMAKARDPATFTNMQSAFSDPIPESVLNYYKDLLQVIGKTHSAIEGVVRDYQGEFSKSVGSPADLSRGFGAGGVPEPMKNLVNFWNSAYQSLTSVTDQYLRAAKAAKPSAAKAPAAKRKPSSAKRKR